MKKNIWYYHTNDNINYGFPWNPFLIRFRNQTMFRCQKQEPLWKHLKKKCIVSTTKTLKTKQNINNYNSLMCCILIILIISFTIKISTKLFLKHTKNLTMCEHTYIVFSKRCQYIFETFKRYVWTLQMNTIATIPKNIYCCPSFLVPLNLPNKN